MTTPRGQDAAHQGHSERPPGAAGRPGPSRANREARPGRGSRRTQLSWPLQPRRARASPPPQAAQLARRLRPPRGGRAHCGFSASRRRGSRRRCCALSPSPARSCCGSGSVSRRSRRRRGISALPIQRGARILFSGRPCRLSQPRVTGRRYVDDLGIEGTNGRAGALRAGVAPGVPGADQLLRWATPRPSSGLSTPAAAASAAGRQLGRRCAAQPRHADDGRPQAVQARRNHRRAPGAVIFRNEVFELIQYAPQTETSTSAPCSWCPRR